MKLFKRGDMVTLIVPIEDDRYPEAFRVRKGQLGRVTSGGTKVAEDHTPWYWVQWYHDAAVGDQRMFENEIKLLGGL